MSYKLIRLIALYVVLICLPLQGLAAVTMPSCQKHSSKVEMHVDVEHYDDMSHCDHQDADHSTKKTPCDKCLNCHLGAAQAIILFNVPVELSGVAPMFTRLIAEIPDLATPSLFHPPRLTFA